MKKRTIRSRFFGSLAVYTLVNFLLIGIALFSYDLYEYRQNPAMLDEEMEEVAIIGSVMLVLFPVSLLVAWGVSRWLLRPWRTMMEQAEAISEGRLEDRIQAENPSDEIGRLAATLNRTFDEYQQLLDRMQRFSYDASHQLRNPLAAIRTKSEVCLKHPRTEAEYRDTIEQVLGNTVRLGRTVDQLLLLARAAGGALDEYREPVDLVALAGGIVDEGILIGELREIDVRLVTPHEPLIIRAVPDLLREALSNLVDNALKFSPDGGRIEVVLKSMASSWVRIEVLDSGPGLSPTNRASIFRPFERDRSAGKEGAGLGLAIVADVCHAHHGTFGVDDSVLGGCRFWMEFPV
jgi:signal transduction histidine kinase